MNAMENDIIGREDVVLVTGANGFIGTRVVETLLSYGFFRVRCMVRPTGNHGRLREVLDSCPDHQAEVMHGNLLSPEDCSRAVEGARVIFHLAAGIEKSFAGSYLNSVVATRNLLEAALRAKALKRFLNVSSFAVYSNEKIKRGGLLDEACEVERHLLDRYEPYVYSKAKQDELVLDYAARYGLPYVIVRPGAVYGPGMNSITGRVGIGTFGIFLHLGGSNRIPLTYVDNCAEAMVLAGITRGVDGEVFNIVDDDLPRSRTFLNMIKTHAGSFRSISIPYPVFFALCWLWERYAQSSRGQLPPVFNRRRCAAYWKGNRYSNEKLKSLLGWTPKVHFPEAAQAYFEHLKKAGVSNA
jgi:nucleoside-diphosphate-sugar epimerase